MKWHACFLNGPSPKSRGTLCHTFHSTNALKVRPQALIDPPLVFDSRVCHTHNCAVTMQVKGTSVPLKAWECLPQTDTCCVNWQVGSWSPNLLLLLLVLEPPGQIHFTSHNPRLWALVPPAELNCKTKPTSVHPFLSIVRKSFHATTSNFFKKERIKAIVCRC